MESVHDATIVWFRHDLRLADNPALDSAVRRGGPVIPVFIWAPSEEGDWPAGSASRWWLVRSIAALEESLGKLGSRLTIRRGPALEALRSLSADTGARSVLWNRRYEPAVIARDAAVKSALSDEGIEAASLNGSLLFEPWTVKTGTGHPYRVFTPYWKSCLSLPAQPPAPIPVPAAPLTSPPGWPRSVPIEQLHIEPEEDWDATPGDTWSPGETGALTALTRFVGQAILDYPVARDFPARDAVSRLSPHLHFGEISPRTVWGAVQSLSRSSRSGDSRKSAEAFLRQLVWREFAYHLLFHFPETAIRPLHPEFERFPWRRSSKNMAAWKQGKTGYPIVDAGMRELRSTGSMHNRVRMVAASFLTKHLLQPWQDGARWFWERLVDADLANNTFGWQWTAGCGADAAPYFRIFNPVSQGERFDPAGDYVRRWVPELAGLSAKWIHRPWEAPLHERKIIGDYPEPIVEHSAARARALAAYAAIRRR